MKQRIAKRRTGLWIGGSTALALALLLSAWLLAPREGLERRCFDARSPAAPIDVRNAPPPFDERFARPGEVELPARARAVYTGWLRAAFAGRYFFRAQGNGRVQVRVGDGLAADDTGRELVWFADLEAGLHAFELVYDSDRAAFGEPRLALGWSRGFYHPRPIPADAVLASPSAPFRSTLARGLRLAGAVLVAMLLVALGRRLLGPARARRLAQRFAVAAGALALSALLAELALRALDVEPRRYVPGDIWALRYTLEQPGTTTRYVGWRPYDVVEYEVPVTINSRGWRDREYTLAKPAGTYRIVVVGDSYVEGKEVPLVDTFSKQLERRLGEAADPLGRRFEVLAMGRGGTSTESQLRTIAEDTLPYDPDLVILSCFPGNDVRENSEELTRIFDDWVDRVYQGRILAAKRDFLDRWSWIDGSWLNHFLVDRGLELYVRHLDWFEPGLTRDDLVSIEAEVYAQGPEAPLWAAAWRETKDELAAARELVRAGGAELLVMVVRSDQLPGAMLAELGGEGRIDPDRPAREVVAFCAQAGLPCLDLGPALERFRAATGERYCWRYDAHWNANGHRVAAEALFEVVAERLGLR